MSFFGGPISKPRHTSGSGLSTVRHAAARYTDKKGKEAAARARTRAAAQRLEARRIKAEDKRRRTEDKRMRSPQRKRKAVRRVVRRRR